MQFRICEGKIWRKLPGDGWAIVAEVTFSHDARILVGQANVYDKMEDLIDGHLAAHYRNMADDREGRREWHSRGADRACCGTGAEGG